MIPKIIHLCWFGKKEYPPLVKHCLDSWSKKLPEYQIKIWDENSFNVNLIPWTKEAYSAKKWAFVSDYIRLWALFEYGGVYLDTDIEVLKDFSALLEDKKYVSSFAEGVLLNTSFIACEKGMPFIKLLKEYYENRHFILSEHHYDETMNPLIFAKAASYFFNFRFGKKEFITKDVSIYRASYFQPYKKNLFMKKTDKRSYLITNNTYTIHHDMGSWSSQNKIIRVFKGLIRLFLPSFLYLSFKKIAFSKRIKKIDIGFMI